MTAPYLDRYLSLDSFPARLALVQEMDAELERLRAETEAARELIELTIAPPVDFIKTAQHNRKQGKKEFDYLKRELQTKIQNWKDSRAFETETK